jgi:hypothetical protein
VTGGLNWAIVWCSSITLDPFYIDMSARKVEICSCCHWVEKFLPFGKNSRLARCLLWCAVLAMCWVAVFFLTWITD